MPRGGARPGAGRPPKRPTLLNVGASDDPLKFLLAVMGCESADMRLRIDAAKAALPFLHKRKADAGKKAVATETAKAAIDSGRFAPRVVPMARAKF